MQSGRTNGWSGRAGFQKANAPREGPLCVSFSPSSDRKSPVALFPQPARAVSYCSGARFSICQILSVLIGVLPRSACCPARARSRDRGLVAVAAALHGPEAFARFHGTDQIQAVVPASLHWQIEAPIHAVIETGGGGPGSFGLHRVTGAGPGGRMAGRISLDRGGLGFYAEAGSAVPDQFHAREIPGRGRHVTFKKTGVEERQEGGLPQGCFFTLGTMLAVTARAFGRYFLARGTISAFLMPVISSTKLRDQSRRWGCSWEERRTV
jgi:hypothetical protein